MKKSVLAGVVVCLLSGCVMANPAHEVSAREVHAKERSHKSDVEKVEQVAASGVPDRLHAIKLRGNDSGYFTVVIGNGYTSAMVKDEPAKITRKNENYYEVTNKAYVIGVYLDENGFSSASSNRPKGRDHGDFVSITD